VRQIQQPPIRKIGVENVDNFFPEEKRNDLAMKLNNLIASPGFAAWLEGEPLDIQRMFYTPEGKPRLQHLQHRPSQRHRAHVLRLAADESTARLDARAKRHHQPARAVLHGRDLWLSATDRKPADARSR